MKRPFRPTQYENEGEEEGKTVNSFSNLSEDILFEVLKHADARTLGVAACVNNLWKKTALDERLWEPICTRHWANIGYTNHQLCSVVLALGGSGWGKDKNHECLSPNPASNPPKPAVEIEVFVDRFDVKIANAVAEETGLPFVTAENKFEALDYMNYRKYRYLRLDGSSTIMDRQETLENFG